MAHEDLQREQAIEGSSDRSFGLVFAAVFAIVAFWPLLSRAQPRWWSVGVAAAFACVALAAPRLLATPNRLWMRFGVWLGRVVAPVATGVLFFVVFTPIGALMRAMGKDPLRLRREPDAETYWLPRTPPGPPRGSLDRQF
jgi:hypothetical protein